MLVRLYRFHLVSWAYVPSLALVALKVTYMASIFKNTLLHTEETVTSFLPRDLVEVILYRVNNGHWV